MTPVVIMTIIELNEDIEQMSFPVLNKNFNELKSIVIGAGYGSSAVGNNPNSEVLNKKLAGHNVIDKIGGYKYNNKPALIYADFDSPINSKKFNKMGSHKPLPLEYSTNGGDSGGPLFRKNQNELELVGIVAGHEIPKLSSFMKHGHYGSINYWTRISVFHDWIMDEISKAE
jgi:hypothetical protein